MKYTYYVLVRFEIQQDEFQPLFSLIEEFFEKEVSSCLGFISSRILTNEDKTIVMNYATWESKETFETFARDIAAHSEISKKIGVFKPMRETFYEFKSLALSV